MTQMIMIFADFFNLKTLVICLFVLFCIMTGLFFAMQKKSRNAIIFISIGMLLLITIIIITWVNLKLAPALQSVWFIPHVAVYMFAYAAIAGGVVLGVRELIYNCRGVARNVPTGNIAHSNQLIKIGTAAMGIGMCLGALWAKKAWGQYWSWDIKETAALITWALFLLYLHLQKFTKIKRKLLLLLLIIGFLSMNFTWFGIKFMHSAKKSPHTFYTTSSFSQ
jgi:ABC-type transport system involved in cytochrome c biogenesis permease subunit